MNLKTRNILSMESLPNILIVDDTPANLFLLESITRKIKVNLIQALSGAKALEKTHGIELVMAIIDVKMPGMNGYELALKMNENRAANKVPVIFMTANYIQEADVLKGYDFGAVDYISKPFASQILVSKINVFLDLFNQKQRSIRDAALLKKYTFELKEANAALIKSEMKYRSYIDNAPDGVFVANETGKYIEVNESASRITGYSKDELLKMSIPDMLPEESIQEGLNHFRTTAINGFSKDDLLFKHKNGTKRWWTVESAKLSETRYLGFTKDITERKIAEAELKNSLSQLKQLTQHIEKVRENERMTISRELHDDLGQALTAVKIDMELIKKNVSDDKVILKIDKVSALVGETIKTVQRLTSQLRPSIIDDLGLEAAIEWYTKEFAERNNMEVLLDMEKGIIIPPETSLNLFRIMQESLTNISRHSKATQIEIGLYKTEESVSFSISDNGTGITENKLHDKTSFGIMGMRERTLSLGGTFEIYGTNNHGTTIKLNIPLINK
jgi:two-component system sensor histidine kinase UhpB